MKKMILLGALAVSFATTSTQGQSVEELLGLNVSAAQTPAEPTLTGHAQAEESPLYFRATVNPLIVGAISLQRAGSNGGATTLNNGKIEFDVGVGFGLSFGWRIPETYLFIEVATGFQWAGVNTFNGILDVNGQNGQTLKSDGGNLYQVPVLFTPGLEFDLGGQWPFLHGGAIRFGPSIGFMYYSLRVNGIEAVTPNIANTDIFDINGNGLVFTYGAMLNLDLFLSHNVALSLGWQLQATAPIDYGPLNVDQGNSGPLSDAKTNFTYTNVMSCGISIYF
jgi:hypothetical protein